MTLLRLVPYALVDDVTAMSAFYVDYLGFQVEYRLDWYVSLIHRERPEYKLDFVQRDYRGHEVVPPGFAQRSAGMVLAFLLEDVVALHDQLVAAGVPIVMPLWDEPWGQRRFMVQDPAGTPVELLQNVGTIAPEFLEENPPSI